MPIVANTIQLANIDEELKRLWDEEQGKNKIRACLFTFIVYAQKTKYASFDKDVIQSIISKFPCRIILIICDDEAKEDALRTSVSLEAPNQNVFCETIQVEVAGALIQRVPFIVLPQILPDLPVFLFWMQDPSQEHTVLPALEPFASRILFDAQSTTNLTSFSRSVIALMDRFECQIGDLNWSALTGWRTLLAQTFEDPDLLDALIQSSFIQINYCGSHEKGFSFALLKAAYLQAWLAAQLGWTFKSLEQKEELICLHYSQRGREIAIHLIPIETAELPKGTIHSIEMESDAKQSHTVFTRHPSTKQVFIQYSDQECCHLPHALFLKGDQPGQAVIDEIFSLGSKEHYRAMLETFSQIPWDSLK